MGETRVDLVHLLEDLRDAYPGTLEETILTEIVANALDSGARRLELRIESGERTLVASTTASASDAGALPYSGSGSHHVTSHASTAKPAA